MDDKKIKERGQKREKEINFCKKGKKQKEY